MHYVSPLESISLLSRRGLFIGYTLRLGLGGDDGNTFPPTLDYPRLMKNETIAGLFGEEGRVSLNVLNCGQCSGCAI